MPWQIYGLFDLFEGDDLKVRSKVFAAVLTWACMSGLSALANPHCAPFSEPVEVLDPLIYLDLPDPAAERVTMSIEAVLLGEQIANGTPFPLSKVYCEIGMFEMRVRFFQTQQDDAIASIVTEAIYEWMPDAEPVGWQLSGLSRRPLCGRGDAPFAAICP